MTRDYRDTAIEFAVADLADAEERFLIASTERDFYRRFLVEALVRIGSLSHDLERERRERYRLVDELRRLRADEHRQVAA